MLSGSAKKKMTPYLLILPVFLFLLLVYGYPLLLTFKYSFQDVSLIGNNHTYVGLGNYKKALSDSGLYGTLFLTFKWTVLTVVLKVGIGFVMALLLSGRLYFKKVNRFLVLVPWAIPQVVVAILWAWILDGQYGYLNYYLQKIGLQGDSVAWLSDPNLAFLATAGVDAWIGIPLVAMIFLSGLNGIPDSLYEAAKVDGANSLQRFRHITLPGLKQVLLITLTLTTIWTFNSFNVIYVLTGGGPMGGTETIIIKIYKEAFGKYHLGMSSALSVIVFIILAVLSLFYWKQLSKGEREA